MEDNNLKFKPRTRKVGEILIDQGFITVEQLQQGLREHKSTGKSLGSVLVRLGFISEEALEQVLAKQMELIHKKSIGRIMVEQGFISTEQLMEGLREQRKYNAPLGEILVKLGFISEKKLIDALSAQFDVQHQDLESFIFNESVVRLIPKNLCLQYKAIALEDRGDTLVIAMADPTNIRYIEHMRFKTGKNIEPVISTESSIIAAQKRFFGEGSSSASWSITAFRQTAYQQTVPELKVEQKHVLPLEKIRAESVEQRKIPEIQIEDGEQVLDLVNETPMMDPILPESELQDIDNPVAEVADQILKKALSCGATAIHIEPSEKEVALKFRINNEMVKESDISITRMDQLIIRFKIMAGMDITDRKNPHEGYFSYNYKNRDMALRVFTFPIQLQGVFIEKLLINVIDPVTVNLDLRALGFSENQLIKVIEILNLKEGIILIIGPSGSGKTMTLYSCINEIKKTPRCVITVEKVIENHLPGVIQSEINIAEGFGFVHGIHAVLRQDPDVIAVSDIDCSDTAEAVIKISTTGHLVLAGMDAKNAVDAIEKLYAMRINPSLVATNIECLLNQRIVRKICGECKAEYQPLAQLVKDNNIEPQTKFLKGKGCTTCGQRGFSGRTGIFEILFPDENIRSAIAGHLDKESLSPLLKVSPTIREHGIQKVLEGITTLEQVISVTE